MAVAATDRADDGVSKAFTSEETEDSSVPGRSVVRAAPGEERPITREGFSRLVAARDAIVAERAPLVGVAASEPELRALDHRIALVTATLDSVRVVEPVPSDGTIRFGSTVELRGEDGRRRRVRLVGPDEAEGSSEVSVLAPLGRALLGARAGSEVEVERPTDTVVFVVERVG